METIQTRIWGWKHNKKQYEESKRLPPNTKENASLVINTTMHELHVVVNLVRREGPHTLPTNMHRALRASHMIAATVLLDQNLAPRALLDVPILPGPSLQQPFLCLRVPVYLPLFTTEPIVFLTTGNANGNEARLATENPISRKGFERVDFGAVGGGAVSELVGVVAEVFEKGGLQ